jgi:hypothetical protein
MTRGLLARGTVARRSSFFLRAAPLALAATLGGCGGGAFFGTLTAGAEVIGALPTAPCASDPALPGAGECLPFPNLAVLSARQTR